MNKRRTSEKTKAASRLLKRLLHACMEAHNLNTQKQLAQFLGKAKSTLNGWLDETSFVVIKPDAFRQIKEKLGATDEDEKIIVEGYPEIIVPNRSSSTRKQRRKGRRKHHNTNNGLFPRAQVVAESRSDAELGSIVRRLFATLMGQPMVSECPSSVKILSAIADKEYSAGDMPFILSKANFRDVDSKDWSKDDILRFQNFANLVLELSRKCLLIVAQLSKENLRDELIRRLGKNLDMLWSTYKVAASVAPIEYIQDIELSKRV